MNKVSVTYRAVGSRLSSLNIRLSKTRQLPIISFDRLAYSDPHRKLPLKTRLLNIFKKVAIAIYTDPLFGSIDKAFLKPRYSIKTSSETYIRSVAGASLVMLVLILVGA